MDILEKLAARTLVAALCVTALAAGAAGAWPVDLRFDVEPGRERFVPLPRLGWYETSDPSVLGVEWLDASKELLLTGLRPGRAHVLLGADGRVALWLVRVGTPRLADPAKEARARAACPGLALERRGDEPLPVRVATNECHGALVELFQTDLFAAGELEVELELPVLQHQLGLLQRAFDALPGASLQASYAGAGLVLEGKASAVAYRRALWTVGRTTLGRYALDDRVEVETPPPPATRSTSPPEPSAAALEALEVAPAAADAGAPPPRRRRPKR